MNPADKLPMNTMKPISQHRELISALADGQLAGEDIALALAGCEGNAEALHDWSSYHLIGEVLRSPGRAAQSADVEFVTKLRLRLAQESSLHAMPSAAPAGKVHREASNDASFRWKLVAGFASLAAVAAIAWNAGAGLSAPGSAPQLASAESSQPVLMRSEQGAIVRDARMLELLAAHRQFGGTSALQMPSGFLRNATFESSPGERR